MLKHAGLWGPLVFVVGQHVPEKHRWLRVSLLVTGGAATAWSAWLAYRKSVEK